MKIPRVCILATKPDGALIEMDSRFRGNDGSLIYATIESSEALSGNRGQHSIRINDLWRICFTWRQGNAYRVEIVDHH